VAAADRAPTRETVVCVPTEAGERNGRMERPSRTSVEQALHEGSPLSAAVKDLLRAEHVKQRSAFNWRKEFRRRPLLPNLRLASHYKYGRSSGLPFRSGEDSWEQSCSTGFEPATTDGPTYTLGSHPTVELGPVVNPPPDGWDGPTLHAYSLLTREETGEISIAAAAAASNFETVYIGSLHGFSGYDTTNSPDGSTKVFGWNLTPSIIYTYVLPNLPTVGPSTLEFHVRLSNDHVLENLLSMWVPQGGADTGTNVRITSTFWVRIYQGLGVLFGLPQPVSFYPNWVKVLEHRVDFEGHHEDYDGLDPNGFVDLHARFDYDGQSTVLFFDCTLGVEVTVDSIDGMPCFCAIDARVVDDDRTMVIPDGVDAASALANPKLLSDMSCPFRVSDPLLCRPAQ
jgi:hypothetical protein